MPKEADSVAIHRLNEVVLTRRVYRTELRGDLVDTFLVRTCAPTTDYKYITALRDDPCAYCGTTTSLMQIDHIVPVPTIERFRDYRQGRIRWAQQENTAELTGACTYCNQYKRRASVLHYLLELIDSTYFAPGSVRDLQDAYDPIPGASPKELLLGVLRLADGRASRSAISRYTRLGLDGLNET